MFKGIGLRSLELATCNPSRWAPDDELLKRPTVWHTKKQQLQGSREVKDYKESKSFLSFTDGYDSRTAKDDSRSRADGARTVTDGARTVTDGARTGHTDN